MLDRTTWLACFMCSFAQPVLSQSITYQLDPITVIATPDRPGAVLERTAETGSRLGISIQETPAAIDIIDRARMDERGDRSAAEAAQGAVGLTYGNPPGDPSIFSFRGFTTNQITQLYDGIRIGPASMTSRPFDSFNLERVEVLKGPASTLFGEGSVGGAINYVTKRPQRGPFTADGLLSYGGFDNLRLGAGLGGPIGERLHYRVDVSQQTSDTFIDRTDFKYFNFTNGLAWDVTDRLNLELNVDASHDKISPYWGTPFVTSALPGAQPINGILRDADGRFIDERLREKNYNVADNDMSSDTLWGRLKLYWRLGEAWHLRNQLYHFKAKRNWRNSEVYAFNPATLLIDRDRFFVSHDQEIIGNRFELAHDAKLFNRDNKFIIGFDYSDLEFFRPSSFQGCDSVDIFNPEPGSYGVLVPAVRATRLKTTALFVEDQFALTERFKLLAGLRTESIDLQRKDRNIDGSARTDGLDRRFHPTSGRIGLIFEARPGLNVYVQYATAADIASNTSNLFLIRAAQNFDLTKGRQFEVGLKQRFWENRGVWTFALYDIERKNLLSRTAQDTASNIGKQSSNGVELGFELQPMHTLRLAADYAYTRARYDRYRDTSSGTIFDDNAPPNVPKHVANLEASYRFLSGLPIELGAHVRYVGKRTGNDSNTLELLGYTTVDASLSWLFKNTRLTLRGRNLFNTNYVAWADVFYPTQVLLGEPRTWELALNARF